MTTKETETETMQNCDGLIWAIVEDDEGRETVMSFMKMKIAKKQTPHDLGHKYYVMIFKQGVNESIDFFSAIIGDPKKYAENISRVGYHGLMIKNKALSKKTTKDAFSSVIKNYKMNTDYLNLAMKDVW